MSLSIGMVCYPTYGGSGVVATELGRALAKRGHPVHFITYQQPARLGGLEPNLYYHEVSVANYPLFDFPPYEQALAGVIAEVASSQSLDLVHVHYGIPHAAAAVQAREIVEQGGGRLPVVTTLHGTDVTVVGQDRWLRPVLKHALERCQAVTAVSESLRVQTVSDLGVKCPIHVIPNFIDMDQAFCDGRDAPLRTDYASRGERLICHVSNFRPIKRVGDVVQVFARIREHMPARLLMVGDGPDRSQVEVLARKLGLGDSVVFFGKLRAPQEVVARTDLLLLLSEQESFGLAALEAMACGVPVITSDRGGLPFVNRHGESGYVSPLGDVDGMAQQAIGLLSDPALLQHFRDGARKRARDFDIQRVIPLYEQLYRSLLTAS